MPEEFCRSLSFLPKYFQSFMDEFDGYGLDWEQGVGSDLTLMTLRCIGCQLDVEIVELKQ
jgi:hypothetical protein